MNKLYSTLLILSILVLLACSGNPEQQAVKLARKAWDAQLQGDLETAAVYLEKAIAAYPDFAEAHTNLGQVYNYLQRQSDARKCYESAIEGFKKRLETHPDDVKTLVNLGGVCAVLGKMGSARESLQKALEKDPANKNAAYLLANIKEFTAAWNQVPPPHPDEQKIQHTILAPL